MKSASEILEMLASELVVHLEPMRANDRNLSVYNEVLGNSSSLLAGLLSSLLENQVNDWDANSMWLDDSLITDVHLDQGRLTLSGMMIWGRFNTTDQWVAPFSFEIAPLSTESNTGRQFRFLFWDDAMAEMKYEEYKKDGGRGIHNDLKWRYRIDSAGAGLI